MDATAHCIQPCTSHGWMLAGAAGGGRVAHPWGCVAQGVGGAWRTMYPVRGARGGGAWRTVYPVRGAPLLRKGKKQQSQKKSLRKQTRKKGTRPKAGRVLADWREEIENQNLTAGGKWRSRNLWLQNRYPLLIGARWQKSCGAARIFSATESTPLLIGATYQQMSTCLKASMTRRSFKQHRAAQAVGANIRTEV